MRLGTPTTNEFMKKLNSKNEEIQKIYQEHLKDLTKTVKTKVMLGDSTITEQETFDPSRINQYYQNIVKKLEGWTIQDITISNNEDLRRIFSKFEIREGNYLISGHMSIQFHVLLYYKPDYRVIECQKELAEIIEQTKDSETSVADMSEEFVVNKLKEIGYKDLDHQNLFEVLYENDELREKIYKEIEGSTDTDFQKLSKKKMELFNELDSFLIETYQTTNVLIDDTRLVSGEEGILCTFDIEFIKDKTKEGLFDPKKMSADVQEKIYHRLDDFSKFLKN